MNKTLIVVTVTVFAGLALIGSSLILIFRPDASATFISNLVIIGGLLTTTVTTFLGLDKIKQQTNAIARSVNGNTTKMINALRNAPSELTGITTAELDTIESELPKDGADHASV